MEFITQCIDALTRAFAVVAGIAVVVMMLHINLDVVMRATINIVPPGTIVFVSNYYMIFLVCMPLAFVERANAHIAVDVFTGLMPGRIQRLLIGWIYLPSALLFALVAYASGIEAVQQFGRGTFVVEQDIRIPVWYGYFALPIGYGLGALLLALRFVRFLIGRGQPPLPRTPEADDRLDLKADSLNYD